MLKGGRPDRLPLMPITMMFAADRLGVKYSEYARNHEVLVEGQIRTAEEFGFDHVSSISDPAREAADYGAQVQWYDDQPPCCGGLRSCARHPDRESSGSMRICKIAPLRWRITPPVDAPERRLTQLDEGEFQSCRSRQQLWQKIILDESRETLRAC
jgi:Uroporphyrinogen decarboxylase (URO-D)